MSNSINKNPNPNKNLLATFVRCSETIIRFFPYVDEKNKKDIVGRLQTSVKKYTLSKKEEVFGNSYQNGQPNSQFQPNYPMHSNMDFSPSGLNPFSRMNPPVAFIHNFGRDTNSELFEIQRLLNNVFSDHTTTPVNQINQHDSILVDNLMNSVIESVLVPKPNITESEFSNVFKHVVLTPPDVSNEEIQKEFVGSFLNLKKKAAEKDFSIFSLEGNEALIAFFVIFSIPAVRVGDTVIILNHISSFGSEIYIPLDTSEINPNILPIQRASFIFDKEYSFDLFQVSVRRNLFLSLKEKLAHKKASMHFDVFVSELEDIAFVVKEAVSI